MHSVMPPISFAYPSPRVIAACWPSRIARAIWSSRIAERTCTFIAQLGAFDSAVAAASCRRDTLAAGATIARLDPGDVADGVVAAGQVPLGHAQSDAGVADALSEAGLGGRLRAIPRAHCRAPFPLSSGKSTRSHPCCLRNYQRANGLGNHPLVLGWLRFLQGRICRLQGLPDPLSYGTVG